MGRINSMTGFATARRPYRGTEITCELRSLNSRYLETFVKLPPTLREYEDAVKEIIRGKIDRGKLNCSITLNGDEAGLKPTQIDENAVRDVAATLNRIRTAAGIDAPLALADLLEFKEMFSVADGGEEDDELVTLLGNLVADACAALITTRATEGANLKKDLLERLSTIRSLSSEIADLSKGNAREEFEKLHQRLLGMLDDGKIDRNRLEMELALISDRVDISEEVVRMNSHIDLFVECLEAGSPIGKKLNFVLQEMHREANTMSSKCSLVDMSHRLVAVKEDIERMREQVQNIE